MIVEEGGIMETKIALFRGSGIRKTLHNNEWWFVISDVVAVLTDSIDPSGYIKDMRRRDAELSKGWGQIATPLWVETPGGKQKVHPVDAYFCYQ
jgi:prophage antirepressor-like protein